MPQPHGVETMIKEIVYAGGGAFDVPLRYYEIIKESNLLYGLDHSAT